MFKSGVALATEPLPCGISSDQLNNEESNSRSISIDSELQSLNESAGENSFHSAGVHADSEENIVIIEQTAPRPIKRKAGDNPVPKLIDNKRKHMERQLSAAQRNEILMNESKEDAQFKRDIAEATR